jgi:hypothetical protein
LKEYLKNVLKWFDNWKKRCYVFITLVNKDIFITYQIKKNKVYLTVWKNSLNFVKELRITSQNVLWNANFTPLNWSLVCIRRFSVD